MAFTFQKATKKQARARVALIGPSGSGKTYSALKIACAMSDKVALIDTEHGSASKYAGEFDFDVLNLDSFSPTTYVEAIEAAEDAGYKCIVIDSLSHAWSGKDGALEQVDQASSRGNKFTAWRDVTPQHNRLIDAIVGSRCHIFATMRSKTEYIVEDDGKGKKVPRKVGMAPIQRDGMEYEFDVVGDLDENHVLKVTKTRCKDLDGKYITKPGKDLADALTDWLSDGEPVAEKESLIGDAGKKALVDFCASFEAEGADKRTLWDIVTKYAKALKKTVSELTELEEQEVRGVVLDEVAALCFTGPVNAERVPEDVDAQEPQDAETVPATLDLGGDA